MLDELVKAVRLHLSERLTSPLIGAFVLSWGAWNYRLFVVIFSGESVEKKFQLIDGIVFPSVQASLVRGLALPLATALAYIFLYPYPAKWVYSFSRKKQREILEIRRKIEDETPLTLEDSRRIRSDLARAEQEFYAELDRKEREIERLKSQLAPQSADEKPSETHQAPVEVDESEYLAPDLISMLQLLDSQGGTATQSALISASSLSRIEAEFNLGELVRLELATRRYSSPKRDAVYTFTHTGRSALLSARKSAPIATRSKSDPDTRPITSFRYRAHGRHGRNVLADTTHDAAVDEKLSFQADVPDGEKLHVVMRGPPPRSLSETSAAWHFSVSGVNNWTQSKYQENTSSCVQHFNAEEGTADMQFSFVRPGQIQIEVFEGESRTATWSKSLHVSDKGSV